MNAVPQLQLLESQVEDGLGELIDAAQRRATQLRRERDAILREIHSIESKIRVWQATRHSLGNGNGQLRTVPKGHLPSKPEAVLAFLAENPRDKYPLIEIRRALVARGWIEDTRKARHALEVAVLNLHKRGAIVRVERGIYKFGASDDAAADTRDGPGNVPLDERENPGEGGVATSLSGP